jgi:hypothetical protein
MRSEVRTLGVDKGWAWQSRKTGGAKCCGRFHFPKSMKTSSTIRKGRMCCALAGLSLIAMPLASAEPQPPPASVLVPVPVAEPPAEVKRPGFLGRLFGKDRPVPKAEPVIEEIVVEEVARDGAKQRVVEKKERWKGP